MDILSLEILGHSEKTELHVVRVKSSLLTRYYITLESVSLLYINLQLQIMLSSHKYANVVKKYTYRKQSC